MMLRPALGMALVVIALGPGCTSVDVDADENNGTYTLILPTDVIESRSLVWHDAADASGDICPSGWVLRSAMDLPSDVMWQINCTKSVAPPS